MTYFSLSDTSSENEYLVGVGGCVVISGIFDFPLLVWNHYLTCQSQGKGKGNWALSIHSNTVPYVEPSSQK